MKNEVLEQVIQNICENCKQCEVIGFRSDTNEPVKITANYCLDGSGYIDVTLYSIDGEYLETCKLKHPTDSCVLPFSVEIKAEPDCDCLD